MTWPFILNTVSLWPSVSTRLLISGLNLPSCLFLKGVEMVCVGGVVEGVSSLLTQHISPKHTQTHTHTPLQQLADNTIRVPARHQSVRGVIEAVSMQAHVSLLHLQVCLAERGWH